MTNDPSKSPSPEVPKKGSLSQGPPMGKNAERAKKRQASGGEAPADVPQALGDKALDEPEEDGAQDDEENDVIEVTDPTREEGMHEVAPGDLLPRRRPLEEALEGASGNLDEVEDRIPEESSPALDSEPALSLTRPPLWERAHPEPVSAEELGSGSLLDETWAEAYRSCRRWGPIWEKTQNDGWEWPSGVRLDRGKMYKAGLLCIPSCHTGKIIRAHHGFAGHPGASRLWAQMGRWYLFANPGDAQRLTRYIQQTCEVCQATEPVRTPFKCPMESTPVPPYLMDSVSIDFFSLPEVRWEGKVYDTIGVCVDRESGWIVATPLNSVGLTAEKMARTMYRQWEMFGIPSVVHSDRGPQFSAAWWRTLCALHGVRVSYGQAYHHQAQGRVENAGQQIMRKLRKMILDLMEEGVAWVDLLPKALRHIHDVPGESGLSPYEVVFGRHRPLAQLPYRPIQEAQGATEFFEKMQALDARAAKALNDLHQKRKAQVNANRKEPTPFAKGSKVWYRPERQPGTDKLAPEWVGPCLIEKRLGAHSYVVEVAPGVLREAHRTQLRPHVADLYSDTPFPLHYLAGKAPELPEATPDEWPVEAVLKHRRRAGKLEFLVKWKGYEASDACWEPWENFFPGYNTEVVDYCRRHKVSLDIAQCGV